MAITPSIIIFCISSLCLVRSQRFSANGLKTKLASAIPYNIGVSATGTRDDYGDITNACKQRHQSHDTPDNTQGGEIVRADISLPRSCNESTPCSRERIERSVNMLIISFSLKMKGGSNIPVKPVTANVQDLFIG